jgi:hypothetical protein
VRLLTIVGGDRERLVVTRRGRGKTVCARGAWVALLGGPSTSPLERSMARQQSPLAAVILGVALAIALRFCRDEVQKHVIAGPNGVIPHWVPLVAAPIQVLVSLAPGFVSGWVAARRELLCGFLTGLFGSVLYSAMFETFWRSTAAGGASEVLFLVGWALTLGVSAGIFAAAAAGTAKLLRSNNRWRGP